MWLHPVSYHAAAKHNKNSGSLLILLKQVWVTPEFLKSKHDTIILQPLNPGIGPSNYTAGLKTKFPIPASLVRMTRHDNLKFPADHVLAASINTKQPDSARA